jgi:hypothetical protein
MPVDAIYRKFPGEYPHQQADAIAQPRLSHRHRRVCPDTHSSDAMPGLFRKVGSGVGCWTTTGPLPWPEPCRPGADTLPPGGSNVSVIPQPPDTAPGLLPDGRWYCHADNTGPQSCPLPPDCWPILYPPASHRYQNHDHNNFIDQSQSGRVTPGNRSKMHP